MVIKFGGNVVIAIPVADRGGETQRNIPKVVFDLDKLDVHKTAENVEIMNTNDSRISLTSDLRDSSITIMFTLEAPL